MRYAFETRLPRGSAEGSLVIYDAESDNGDVLLTIDPHENYAVVSRQRMAEVLVRALNDAHFNPTLNSDDYDEVDDGTSGQDRENYTDDQDRDSYSAD